MHRIFFIFAALLIGLPATLRAGAPQWLPAETLRGNATADFLFLGSAVSLLGGTAALGAYGDGQNGEVAGAVQIFRENGASWIEQLTIRGSDTGPGDAFGWSLDGAGDELVVGALVANAAYLFDRNSGGANNWGQVRKLIHPGSCTGCQFGNAVAIDGEWIAVGAPLDSTDALEAGSVFLFHRDQGGAGNWGFVSRLASAPAEAGAFFGYSVSMQGGRLAVGAYGNSSIHRDGGAVYLFDLDAAGTAWNPLAELRAPDGAPGDWFGFAVAVHGDRVLAGAPKNDHELPNTGAAYLFGADAGGPGNWGLVRNFIRDGLPGDALMGYAVALSDELAAVGAPLDSSGRVFVYGRDQHGPDQWGLSSIAGHEDSPGRTYHQGRALDLSGQLLLIGHPAFTFGADALTGRATLHDTSPPSSSVSYRFGAPEAGLRIEPSYPLFSGAVPDAYRALSSLPSGLSLDPISGVITGAPDNSGLQSFNLGWDSAGQAFTRSISISVGAASTETASGPVANVTYPDELNFQLDTFGSLYPTFVNTPVTGKNFSIAPPLPTGLSLHQETGVISGIPELPTPVVDYIVTVASAGAPIQVPLSLKVYPRFEILRSSVLIGNYVHAVDDDWAVISAHVEGTGVTSTAGALYFFKRQANGAWWQMQKRFATDPVASARLGISVDVEGARVASGAYLEGQAVYLFERSGEHWDQVRKISNGFSEWFGYRVALSGDRLLVGARNNWYIHEKDQGGVGSWGQVKASSHTGIRAVALDADLALVGAPSGSGNAQIRHQDAGGANQWGLMKVLTFSGSSSSARFGTALEIAGDIAVVGAPGQNSGQGAVFVYHRDQGGTDNWGEVARITEPVLGTSSFFGETLAMGDGRLFVGETREDKIYVYTFNGNLPVYSHAICPEGPAFPGFADYLSYGGGSLLAGQVDDELFETGITALTFPSAPTGLVYAVETMESPERFDLEANHPDPSGGEPERYIVDPPLPPGVYLDPDTGIIVGRPPADGQSVHTVTGANTAGAVQTTVTIVITPQAGVATLVETTGGDVQLSFSKGEPGAPYIIECSSDLGDPLGWQTIGTETADAAGDFGMQHTPAGASVYYRSREP